MPLTITCPHLPTSSDRHKYTLHYAATVSEEELEGDVSLVAGHAGLFDYALERGEQPITIADVRRVSAWLVGGGGLPVGPRVVLVGAGLPPMSVCWRRFTCTLHLHL